VWVLARMIGRANVQHRELARTELVEEESVVVGQHAAEREAVDWQLGFVKQCDLERFGASLEERAPRELGAKAEVNLADVRETRDQTKIECARIDRDARFLERLAARGFLEGFVHLDESAGNAPPPDLGCMSPSAHHESLTPVGETEDQHLRILIVDRSAARADMTVATLSGNRPDRDGMATLTTEIHAMAFRIGRPESLGTS
jgi:hypothetical protein